MPSVSEFERLFLLEFFVDSVYVKNSSIEDVDDSSLCVSFQFLNYPVMLVCEEDFAPKTKSLTKGTNVVFKSGKSCLFSLRTDQSKSFPSEFDLTIKVIQNLKKKEGKGLFAETIVRLGSSFTSLMKNLNNSTTPTAYVKQDTFPLKDKNGDQVGNLAAFVRLSCFGKLIVTQFQLAGEDNKNYMFKGTDPKKIFTEEDKAIKPFVTTDDKDSTDSNEEIPGDTPYKDLFGFPEESDENIRPERDGKKDEESEEEKGGEGDQELSDKSKATKEQQTKDVQGKQESEVGEIEEDYKEIGAEINGNSITIRVLKKGKRPKKQSTKSSEEVPQLLPLSTHPFESSPPSLCTCHLLPRCAPPPPPPPPRMCPQGCPPSCCPPTPQCPPECCPPPSYPPMCCPPPSNVNPYLFPGGPQIGGNLQMQGMNVSQCPKEDCPLGLYNPTPPQNQMDLEPGMVAMKGDQVIFQMANRPAGEPISEREKKLANSIYYKLASGESGKEAMKNTVQISPQNPGELSGFPYGACLQAGGGPVSGLPIDNKQDMFLLKVQQNSDAVDAKSKLEMELRTPKTKELKPETNTKNTQYVTTDFPAPEKKPIPEKGKKKKK